MENFVVSARKYRPSTFDTVVGQQHITQTLKNAIKNNQLAHAFLFCGPRGVGKTTCARILAKTINCLNVTAGTEPCNECESCRSFNGNGSFNIYELDAASNNSVEDIRNLVEQVRYPPQSGKFKIYIIDEVHMLSSQAFNAFLKTLEEPPSYAKFILATTERHKILPTILSRCQVFDFHRIKVTDSVAQLKLIAKSEGIEAEEEAFHEIAQKADGAMRDALSIFDRLVSSCGKIISYKDVIANLNILDHTYYFKAVDFMLHKNVPGMLLMFDEVLSNGFDAQHFLSGLEGHIRDLVVCKYPDTVKLLEVAPSVAGHYMSQSQACSPSVLMNALNLLNKCEIDFRSSKNPRLHVELTLMKLCHIQQVIDLKTEEDKKKIPDRQVIIQPAPPVSLVSEPENQKIEPEKTTVPISETIIKPLPPLVRNHSQSKLEKIRSGVNGTTTEPNVQKIPFTSENESQPETLVDPAEKKNPVIDLDESSFLKSWDAYLQQLSANRKISMVAIYKNASVKVRSERSVELGLSSLHESEMFEDDRTNILPFMRNIFGQNFDFTIVVNQQVNSKKAFTAEEKFKLMSNKNPLLIELKNALGLELE
ncbi:MAG: DNA polymerase III subunit gamma/tau [Bacteroidia bacterium]